MDQSLKDDKFKSKPSSFSSTSARGFGEKEKEVSGQGKEVLKPVGKELEPPKELKEAGVRLKKEEIKLPPPVEKLGAKAIGLSAPPPPPTISLPLSDDQVIKGLAAPLLSSLRWLAEFCLRQLKRAHISLKKIHGKIVRVKD